MYKSIGLPDLAPYDYVHSLYVDQIIVYLCVITGQWPFLKQYIATVYYDDYAMVYRDVCKLLRKGASCAATAGTGLYQCININKAYKYVWIFSL